MSYHLAIKHNIEVAHRLSLLPGKCENIHGHSMWVTLEVHSRAGQLDQNYLMDGLDFGSMKKAFRSHLDGEYDHRLLLNAEDPLLQQAVLPGVKILEGDPSTENIARLIGKWAQGEFGLDHFYRVDVWETSVNKAGWQG